MTTETQRKRQRTRDAVNREMSANKKAAGVTQGPRVDLDVLAERLAEIPADTRTLTARICGDPLPGRRAIDRRDSR